MLIPNLFVLNIRVEEGHSCHQLLSALSIFLRIALLIPIAVLALPQHGGRALLKSTLTGLNIKVEEGTVDSILCPALTWITMMISTGKSHS